MKECELQGSVFVVSYGGGHAAALAPVAARLVAGGAPVTVLALTTAPAVFQRAGVPTIGMADLLPRVPVYAEAQALGETLAAAHPPHSAVSLKETQAYLGSNYVAMRRRFGEEVAASRYAVEGRQAFLPVDFFVELFKLYRPAVVLATSAPRSERAALEAARELGIPSVLLVDLFAATEIEWCASENYATKICVLNDSVVERFVQRGVPRDRLVVTGNPSFDRFAGLDVATMRRKARAERGIADDQKLVVWVSQLHPNRHPISGEACDPQMSERVEACLHRAFADREDVHLVLRLHPSEDRPRVLSGPRTRYSDASESLDALLCAADCIVNFGSTVGFEASMIGVPVVQCLDSPFARDLPLGEMGVAYAVKTHEEAAACIDRIFALPTAKSTSPAHLAQVSATEAITQQVMGVFSAS